MRVSQPAATVAGMVDRVTLGNPASPLSGASLAAVAAAGMPPSAAGAASLDGLRILLGLQGQGFHLQHKRRFWIPLLMHRRIEKTADEFLKDLEEGSTRLEISNDKHAPVAVRGKDDLRALDAFYLKASTTLVPQPALAGAVRAMADGGCRFFHKEEDVGPYGAWKALCAAKVKPVETYKTGYQTLASAQDASRMRFFEVDGVADGLDHPQEAMALKALAGKGAKFWTNSEYQYNYRNGSGAYHDLFQGEKPPDSIQAGTDHPLVRFTAKDLASPAQCVSAYDNALADLKKLEGIGLQSSAAAAYYLEMARPVGGETLDERCGWLKQLLDVTPNRPEQAFEAYKFLRDNLRSGDTMTAAITDFLPLRPCVDDYCTRHACDAFLMLRDKMDESLPGRETPEEKGKLFVELFKLTRNAGSSSDVWKKLEGTAPRAERVAAFATLHAAESSYTEHALNDYGAITSAHKPGETLTQVVAEFMTLRPLVRKYDYDSTRNAFNFIRNELDTALAGSWAHDEKKAMYVTLLEMLGKHESAKQWLFKLAGEGTPPTDLPQRIETLKALTQAGEGGIDSANQALSTILPLVRGGETLAAAAEDYVALRKPLPEYHVSDATAAFTFVRKDLASALPGPWTDAQRREIYDKLLTACKNHALAQNILKTMTGVTEQNPTPAPLTDFPEQVDALLALSEVELNDPNRGMKALAAVRGAAAGTLKENVENYKTVRGYLGHWETDVAAAMFEYAFKTLDPARRAQFLKVQSLGQDFDRARKIFEEIQASGQEIAEKLNTLEKLGKAENGGLATARLRMDALVAQRRPGESLDALASEFVDWQGCFRGNRNGEAAVAALTASRTKIPAGLQDEYKKLIKGTSSVETTQAIWDTLEKGGSAGTFPLRLARWLAEPADRWYDMLGSWQHVTELVPASVDRERGVMALLSLSSRDGGLPEVVIKKMGAPADPTTELEWLCEIMKAARREDYFVKALDLVGDSPERRALLSRLLAHTHETRGGFDAALALQARVQKVPPAQFAAVAQQAAAIADAMRGHTNDAAAAFVRILDGCEHGIYGALTFEEALARFAEMYATNGELEPIMHRLEQEVRSGSLEVKHGQKDLVIGGIRVPRKKQA